MQADVKKKNGTVVLAIEVPEEEMERFMRRAASDLGRETEIKGFRTGAAPYDVLVRTLGTERVFKAAAERAVRETYVRALLDNGIETIGSPEIAFRKLAPGNPLVFTATAALMPSVTLGPYDIIPVAEQKVTVTDEEVERALGTLRKSRATYTGVERPARRLDRVEIDFVTKKGGVPVEGGTSKQHPLIVGEGHFMPGFEEGLVGMRAGEEKQFSLTAPSGYYVKELAGRMLDFTVTMLIVQEVALPPLDDAFAKNLGAFGSLGELTESITDGLRQEKESREKEKKHLKIIEHITRHSDVAVPDELVGRELETMERELSASLAHLNIEKESYLSHLGKSMEEMKEGWREQAVKRVASALVLRTIAAKENVHVSGSEVDERVARMLQSVSSPDEVKDINMEALRDHAHASLRNEKVFELLEKRTVVKPS